MTNLDLNNLDLSSGSEENVGLTAFLKIFSQHCDAILHGQNHEKWGYHTIPEQFKVLEQKGCFVPDFYMVNPLYYIHVGPAPFCLETGERYVGSVKNGAIFITISEDEDDLDNLRIKIADTYDPEIIENLPVVLFRHCTKPIGLDGICDDESADLSAQFNCKNDTSEFIGVFKAQRKEKSGSNNVFKMTKIFDRYYFDPSKIQIEIGESH